jgi:hypothetical protein
MPWPGAPFRNKSEHRRNPQDDREELDELAQQAQGRGSARNLFDAVGAVFAQPAPGLWRGETVRGGAEAAEGAIDGKLMDFHQSVACAEPCALCAGSI